MTFFFLLRCAGLRVFHKRTNFSANSACVTHREALRDGHLDVEEKDSGSESSADGNRLLGIAKHVADAGRV